MKNIKINKRIVITVLAVIVLVLIGWFSYHSYQKKQVALVKSYLEAGKEDLDKEDIYFL